MSSPPDSGAANHGPKKHDDEQVTFQFCHECSNMLYPKEDKDARKLMYTCRTCQHTVEATSNCIYRNMLKSQVGDTAGVTQDVALDPTVGGPSDMNITHQNITTTTPTSALVMCGCCGQVIMCSECESHPAYIPETDRAAAASEPSTPPKSYQAELLGPIMASSPDQQAWTSMLNEIAKLDLAPVEMDIDDDFDDLDEWEPEMDDLHTSNQFINSPSSRTVRA